MQNASKDRSRAVQDSAPAPAPRCRIAFATHAWERDYEVVLDPRRFEMIASSCCVDFVRVIIVLNNFNNTRHRDRATRLAEKLMELQLATDILDAQDYLQEQILLNLGLTPEIFWKQNPFFATSQLTALHFARMHADYLLHFCGDVWLERKGKFIDRAISELRTGKLMGMNLCRNIYIDQYPQWAEAENENLWISKGVFRSESKDNRKVMRGFGLSDHAYLLRLDIDYQFTDFSPTDYADLIPFWPTYASPCFEMYFSRFLMDRSNIFSYAALKPIDNMPITKHKDIHYHRLKILLYKMAGRWTWNGKYGTKC